MASGFKRLRRKLNRIERDLERKPQRAVERGAAGTVAEMKRNVVENDAVASTDLYRGISYTTHGMKGVVIRSSAPHSGFVEFGTGPKHIMNPYTRRYDAPSFTGELVAALTEWAAIKPSLHTENPAAVGWAVARAISGESDRHVGGTAPQPFFVPAWEEHKPRIINRVEYAVQRSLRG